MKSGTSCFFISLVIVTFTGVGSCARNNSPKFSDLKELASSSDPIYWKNDRLALTGISRFIDKENPNSLVMVSFWADSPLAKNLESDPRTLLFQTTRAPGRGQALLKLRSNEDLSTLAALAHDSHYFGCGNLEVVSGIPLLTQTTQTNALYNETVRLAEVEQALAKVDSSKIRATMAVLEAMGTRHHKTASGLAAPATIKTMFEEAGATIPGFSVQLWDHASNKRTNQASVIASIPGTEDDATTVVFGSHLDSINSSGVSSPAPGADDNASGVATLIEVVRTLAASGATFKRRIEFHAYAAEEVGLIGSSEISSSYSSSGRKVAAMFQIDMNSYSETAGSNTIYLITKDTTYSLIRSLKDLLTNYLGGDFEEMDLEGGTSDHKSWKNNGYPAVFPFENPTSYNKALHSAQDTSTTANNSGLSARFAKLAVAFASHQAGLQSAAAGYAASLQAPALSSDISLAIVNPADQAESDYFQIGIGAAPEAKTVEYCFIAETTGPCLGELFVAEPANGGPGSAGRALFLDLTMVKITNKNLIKLSAYDAQNKKIAERSARLIKK